MLKLGSVFPAFELLNERGEQRTLKSFSGKWLVLYFYPKDNTPGCTIEARGFSKALTKFHDLGAEVVGVSKDSINSHLKFCDKQGLKITLLSDPERALYAAAEIGKKKMMGHEMYKRSTYILDPKGRVAKTYEDVMPLGHEKECLKAIKELQSL